MRAIETLMREGRETRKPPKVAAAAEVLTKEEAALLRLQLKSAYDIAAVLAGMLGTPLNVRQSIGLRKMARGLRDSIDEMRSRLSTALARAGSGT